MNWNWANWRLRLLLLTILSIGGVPSPAAAAPPLHLDGPLFDTVDVLGNLYVADFGATRQRMVEISGSSGRAIKQWKVPAIGVAMDGRGHVYAAGLFGITEYTASGVALATWGVPQASAGQLIGLEGITASIDGTTYVADAFRHRVLKYAPNHTLVGHWPMRSNPKDEEAGPNGITVDDTGNVFVTDGGKHRVLKYNSMGRVIASWTLPGRRPHLFGGFALGGIALDHDRNIYVVDRWTDTLVKLSPTGSIVSRIRGSGAGKLVRPYGIALDTAGDLYVTANFGTQSRVVKLSRRGSVLAVWQ